MVNTVLDFLFDACLHTGVAGATWATVAAQASSALLCFLYLKRHFPALLFGREDCRVDRDLTRRTLRYGLVSTLQKSSLYFGKFLMQGIVNSLGVLAITAYTATTRIESFANAFGSSACQALSVFVAQNTGAGNAPRAHRGLRCASSPSSIYFEALVGYFNGIGRVNAPLLGVNLHISLRIALSYWLAPTLGFAAIAWGTGVGWIAIVSLLAFACLRADKQKNSRAVLPAQEPRA